jgi:molecular chaperone DnaJ
MANDGFKDPYAVLGVSKSASEDEIRKVYRRLAKKHHPDMNPGNKAAEEKFKEVSAAYEVLSSPEKRKLYDEFGEAALRPGFDAEKARAYREWTGSQRSAAGAPSAGGAAGFDFGEIFGDLFRRGGRNFDPDIFDQSAREAPSQTAELMATVDLDFAQALRGAQVELRVPTAVTCSACKGTGDQPGTKSRTCPDCNGTGQRKASRGGLRMTSVCPRCGGSGKLHTPCKTCGGVGTVEEDRPVTVRIPPGAEDGSKLDVPRPGLGNLVIVTRVRPHPFFRREGLDLYLKLPVSVDEAYNGATIEIPTPNGPVQMKVPPRSQAGSKLRLRGQGVTRGKEHGDLFVELDVRLPDREDAKFAEAARGAASAYSRSLRSDIHL